MTTYKNTSGDYTITGATANAVFTINYANTVFNGNVIYTVPATTDFAFLTVAANNTGAIQDGGLLMKTGASSYAGLRFDVPGNVWQLSSAVYSNGAPIASYANIATGSATVGAPEGAIQFNQSSSLGGNVNLTFDYANSVVTLKGSQAFGNTATPANVSNAVTVYSNAVGSGGTGLYITSSAAADELVSKSKAIVFAIIF